MDIRLAPLYDLVSTIYYPELSGNMAMKIGGEYSSGKVTPKDFERLAEETRLAKPIVKRRVPDLADTVLAPHAKTSISPSVSLTIPDMILKPFTVFSDHFQR